MSFMRWVFSVGKEKINQYYSGKMASVKLLRDEVIHLREIKEKTTHQSIKAEVIFPAPTLIVEIIGE